MTDPIDAAPSPPPPSGQDANYLTHDLVSALDRAVRARVERRARELGIGRRQAAVLVLREIEQP